MSTGLADASVLIAREDLDDAQHEDAALLLSGRDRVLTIDLAADEVTNVAVRAWNDLDAAARLQDVVFALEADGGLLRVDEALASAARELAARHDLSVHDAAYVAAAQRAGARLVSCDVRDLVSRGLAVTPDSVSAP